MNIFQSNEVYRLQLIIKTDIMCSHENYTLGVEIVDMVILQTIMMIILTYM